MSRRAIVVGGGVIGAGCAHYLTESDWQVTIVERKRFGCGASHANCGLISPSHILPLPGPGVIGKTMKAMFSPNSPFSIKPRLDPALWSWLIRFARHCNMSDFIRGGKTLQAMLNSSRSLYDDLFANNPLDAEFQHAGVLFPFLSKAGMEHFGENNELLRKNFGAGAQRYDRDDVSKLEPALKTGLAGGWYFSEDAHLKPDKLMSSWRKVLESRGVIVLENREITGFGKQKSNGGAGSRKVTTVKTPQGDIEGDVIVVATGAWTPLLNTELECKIPIQPGKGYSLTMARPSICPKIPMIFEEHRVAVTPWPSGYRLGSTMEFAGYDSKLNPRRIMLLRNGASHFLREPTAEPVVEEWCGWRPMTPDSLPIIGRCPAFDNVFLAAGHNMLGISMAPATGKLIAELINGIKPHLPIEPMSIRRF